jgi:adenosylcobyric acid synthase
MSRSLFIGGTSSNAGKSWMTTAICAWLRARGVAVAPFKAQNMSNHSYPCRDGGEIGRAQVAQAEACGLEPETRMNPILLKPNGDGTSQVILNGRVWKTLSAREYYEHVDELLPHVLVAHANLASRFDVVVIEGAGSVSEINLRRIDLVNLGLATRIGAPWVLVADIERGGVFASVLGTIGLLTPEERGLLRGVLINKFRGDRSLFDEGVTMLESRSGVPCLGVFPYADDLHVDAEDSLSIARTARGTAPPGARIAILSFPRISNATDFRLLTWADWITSSPAADYDFIILPGSKHTMSDLAWLREHGLDRWVREQHQGGATIIGICGGFQMLGDAIQDPEGVESFAGDSVRGLGLLRADTVLWPDKTTSVVAAATPAGTQFSAYEIHAGVTMVMTEAEPFATLEDGTPEGVRGRRVIGTYLHGALENAAVCSEIFGIDVTPAPTKESEYRRLADWFDRYAIAPDSWI